MSWQPSCHFVSMYAHISSYTALCDLAWILTSSIFHDTIWAKSWCFVSIHCQHSIALCFQKTRGIKNTLLEKQGLTTRRVSNLKMLSQIPWEHGKKNGHKTWKNEQNDHCPNAFDCGLLKADLEWNNKKKKTACYKTVIFDLLDMSIKIMG